jgi:hypothetical protein
MSVEQVCSRTEDEIALSKGDDGVVEEEVGGDDALLHTEDKDDEVGDGGDNASSNKVFEVMGLAAAASDSSRRAMRQGFCIRGTADCGRSWGSRGLRTNIGRASWLITGD